MPDYSEAQETQDSYNAMNLDFLSCVDVLLEHEPVDYECWFFVELTTVDRALDFVCSYLATYMFVYYSRQQYAAHVMGIYREEDEVALFNPNYGVFGPGATQRFEAPDC